MDFGPIADSAVATIQSAATSAGPGVATVAGIIVAIGVIISLIKKTK